MKTLLLTLGLTGVFFGLGVVVLRMQASANGPADAPPADSTAIAVSPPSGPDPTELAALADELDQMRIELAAADLRADSLRAVIEGRQTVETDASETAAELAGTLTKLEGEALAEIVQRLDGRSFVRLYQATSARNRSRLLDALTPAQAAAFVRHQLPGGAPVHAASDRDSTAAPR